MAEIKEHVVVIDLCSDKLLDVVDRSECSTKGYTGVGIELVDVSMLSGVDRIFLIKSLTDNKDGFIAEFLRRTKKCTALEWLHARMPAPVTLKDRQLHSLTVANEMRKLAPLYRLDPLEMYTLGFLHDIGYGLSENGDDHNFVGGEHLRQTTNYKYWQEIFWHGYSTAPYSSPALDLLNYVDLRTSPYGDVISTEERLDNIASRYGYGSSKYTMAKELVGRLVLPDPPPLK